MPIILIKSDIITLIQSRKYTSTTRNW